MPLEHEKTGYYERYTNLMLLRHSTHSVGYAVLLDLIDLRRVCVLHGLDFKELNTSVDKHHTD